MMNMKITRRCRKSQWVLPLCTIIEYSDPYYSSGFWGQILEITHKEQLCSVHLSHSGGNSQSHVSVVMMPTLALKVMNQLLCCMLITRRPLNQGP